MSSADSEDNYSTCFTGLLGEFSDFAMCEELWAVPGTQWALDSCLLQLLFCAYLCIAVLLSIVFVLPGESRPRCRQSLFSLDCDFLEGGVYFSFSHQCPSPWEHYGSKTVKGGDQQIFSCKGPNSKYFWFYETYDLSSLVVQKQP